MPPLWSSGLENAVQIGLCDKIGHHATASGVIIHDLCKRTDPAFLGRWAQLVPDWLGQLVQLMPLTQAVTSIRSMVRRFIGNMTRFPVLPQGNLIYWVPPEDLDLNLYVDGQEELTRE